MDLISREAIHEREITNPENDYEYGWNEALAETDIHIPSAFEGMTNGEVMKAIFPDCIDYHGIIEVKTHLDMGKTFRRSWWDSPYKGQDGLI